MKKEFVMRGQTSSATGKNSEVLNFSGHKKGYAYRLTEFQLYASTPSGAENLFASITAGKSGIDPDNIDFTDEGLIATSMISYNTGALDGQIIHSVVNDTFMITQDLIITVASTQSNEAVNWQCRFESVKMSGPEEAVTNYKQFLISDV